VTLLSASVIFHDFCGHRLEIDRLDYSSLSHFLIEAGIGILVCRVFLYTWDVKHDLCDYFEKLNFVRLHAFENRIIHDIARQDIARVKD
jgi:hypothetical protein